jgi:thiol-disulfide isomerase/thioredoxin
MTKKYLPILVVALLFAGMGAYAGWRKWNTRPIETNVVAQLLAQTMFDAKGHPQNFASLKGKTLIVNFWATWCPPCVEEMPELSALQAELTPRNMQIIGIGIDNPANIADFAARYKIDYPLFTAGINGTELSRQFGNQSGGLPFTVLVDAKGAVKKTYLGRLKINDLRKDLAGL